MIMQLTYKDVWLDYFINKQYWISQLISGDTLTYNGSECLNAEGRYVLKFSKQFMAQLKALREK